jgi:sec-independent protein translocase protein TatA
MYDFALLDLGTPQLLLILAIALLLFGGKKLPELSKSVAQSVKELRNGLNDGKKNEKQQAANSQENSAS